MFPVILTLLNRDYGTVPPNYSPYCGRLVGYEVGVRGLRVLGSQFGGMPSSGGVGVCWSLLWVDGEGLGPLNPKP